MKKSFSASLSLVLVLAALVVAVPGAAARVPQGDNAAAKALTASPTGDRSANAGGKFTRAGLPTPDTYIVVLTDPALAAYQGGIQGLPATSPQATGETRLNSDSAASLQYKSYLAQKQSALLAAMSRELGRSVAAIHQYKTALNGIAVRLSPAEAERMAKLSGVQKVLRDHWSFPATDTTPAFIGATSIWSGASTGGLPGTKGEGIIVGVIDTGIWPEHPSFKDDGSYPAPPASWKGFCQKPDDGTSWLNCTHKLIGAQHFLDAYIAALGAYDGIFNSARDDNSHGTHTASTAAGNEGVAASIQGRSLGKISGIAPRAYVAAYKALGPQGGLTSDLVAAIDKAVADGVDVINYSIGGPSADPWQDGSALAMLNARAAGVFVAVSAGNAGPDAYTIGAPGDAPWVTTVGASASDRQFLSEIKLNPPLPTPTDTTGGSLSGGVTNDVFVDADNYIDRTGADGRQCLNPFAAGTFKANEVVLCERGENARVAKSANVAAGGAGGMVLANSAAEVGLVSETHSVPTVHVSHELGELLRQHLASHPGALISFAAGKAYLAPHPNIFPDSMGDFSSRGPADQGEQQYLKPVITAPGVDVLAGYSPRSVGELPQGQYFGAMSGTSMSSPHIAGAGALLADLHPNWSPAEIESALTTTAIYAVTKEDHITQADAFDMGSGRVDLLKASRVGLLLDEVKSNYLAANPATGGNPTTLNTPSLTDGLCLAECSWTRTVSSALGNPVTWTASVDAPAGIAITVTPAQFTLAAGATQEIRVTANVEGIEPDGSWVFARLTLTPGAAGIPAASLPVTVRPSNSIIPARAQEITDQKSGRVEVEITAREITAMTLAESGLVKASTRSQALTEDPTPDDPFDDLSDGSTFYINVDVPAGAARLVAETLESTAVDVDLYMGTGATPSSETAVCRGVTPSTIEYCNVNQSAAGQWWIMAQNWAAGDNPPDEVVLRYGVVREDNGNLTASGPSAVPARQPFTITLDWALPELEPQDVYYGAAQIGTDPANPANVGFVNLDLLYTGQARLRLGSESIELNAVRGHQSVKHWTLHNDGDIALNWSLGEEAARAAAPVVLDVADSAAGETTFALAANSAQRLSRVENGRAAAPLDADATAAAPDAASFTLKIDDGAAEASIGTGGQFLWLNRFTPQPGDYPFILNEARVYFAAENSNVALGDVFDLFVWEDTDGDHNPATGAVYLAGITGARITRLGAYSSYPLSKPILLTEPGDILIGAVYRASGNYYPAAQDTSSHQKRSWVGLYASGIPGNPPALPSDLTDGWGLIDSFGLPGNWMIRGAGQKCSAADELPWLTVTPTRGAIAPAGHTAVELAVDATGMQPGVYQGTLCLMTNAGNLEYPLLAVPVKLTVLSSFANFLPLLSK